MISHPNVKVRHFGLPFVLSEQASLKIIEENLIYVVFQGKCTISLLDSWVDEALTLVS